MSLGHRYRVLFAGSVALGVLAFGSSSLGVVPSAAANGNGPLSGRGPHPTSTNYDVVGQAAPDECWQPPADPTNPGDYGIYDTGVAPTLKGGTYTCPKGYVPKVNQAYVWGLTQTQSSTTGDNIWFGTVANTLCLVEGSFMGITTPMMTDTWTCEFGSSPYADGTNPSHPAWMGDNVVPAELGDWRPPELFRYTPGSGQPVNLLSLNGNTADAQIQGFLNMTVGIRSAGSVDDPYDPAQKIIFFAGPTMSTQGGITVFAFHDDGTFIGATVLPAYNDIRRWVTVGSGASASVYTGVGLSPDLQQSPGQGGAVLKWTPTSDTADGVFNFTPIAYVGQDVAELTLAGNRLVAGTWPNFASNLQPGTPPQPGNEASVYISPEGTPIADLNTTISWGDPAWTAQSYEPDYATAMTYGVGAMSYFDGYLYWGTMHVPGVAAAAELQYQETPVEYGGCGITPTTTDEIADFIYTNRAFSLYRMSVSSDGTTGDIQLLYGDTQLPAYNCQTGWQTVDNNMGQSGLYGTSGFGNVFNNYDWSMAQYHGQLYVGTMDWSYLASQMWSELAPQLGLPSNTPNPLSYLSNDYGADLYMFSSADSAGQALYTDGVGNYLNYGVRNMVSTNPGTGTTTGDTGLYLGMANPMNLATSKRLPPGGWELINLPTGG